MPETHKTTDMERLYAERLNRYTTVMRNEMPDRVPIRPFVAEFTGKYAGYTCQQLAHDYEQPFAAARKCAADFEWDACEALIPHLTHVGGFKPCRNANGNSL